MKNMKRFKVEWASIREHGTDTLFYSFYNSGRVPLERARQIAADYNVEDVLAPLFDIKDEPVPAASNPIEVSEMEVMQ